MNLYDFILSKTKGSIDKHVINKELRSLSSSGIKLTLEIDLIGASAKEGVEKIDNNRQMLNGKARHFQKDRDKVFLVPSSAHAQSDEVLLFSRFSDSEGNDFYVSDETGMFLESASVKLAKVTFHKPPRLPVQQERLNRIREYFDRYREEHGMTEFTDNQIYTEIGSPSRERLWADLRRLWPKTFNMKFQKNDFSQPPLREINFKRGTGVSRKNINPLLSKT